MPHAFVSTVKATSLRPAGYIDSLVNSIAIADGLAV